MNDLIFADFLGDGTIGLEQNPALSASRPASGRPPLGFAVTR